MMMIQDEFIKPQLPEVQQRLPKKYYVFYTYTYKSFHSFIHPSIHPSINSSIHSSAITFFPSFIPQNPLLDRIIFQSRLSCHGRSIQLHSL